MLAQFEKRAYAGSENVWVGKYKNLQNISHWHMEHELIACIAGSAKIWLDNTIYTLSTGQCIFCQSGSTHSIDAEPDCTLLVCIFNEKMNASITAGNTLCTPVFEDRFEIRERLSQIHKELSKKPRFYEKKTEAIICEVLVDLYRNLPLQAEEKSGKTMDKYKELLSKIDREYEFITFETAAKYMNFTEAYFSKYFKRQSGMTFSQYLNIVRIEKAVDILTLHPSIKVADLMLRCGFETIRSFNRSFKMITGYSPTTLPQGYVLNTRSIPSLSDSFDPTSRGDILVP